MSQQRRAARAAHAHQEEEGGDEHKESSRGGGAAAAASVASAAPAAVPSAADVAAALSNLTSGLSWTKVVNACKSLSKQLQAEMLALPKLHQPLADVALAALRRAGRDKEDDEPCKSTVERSRSHLQRLVEQEEQLGALLEALSSAQTAASSGALQPDVNWAEYIGKLVADIEASAAYRRKLVESSKKTLGEFSESCWRVNHGAEPMPGGRAARGAAGAGAGTAGTAAGAEGEGAESEGGEDDDDSCVAVGAAPLQLKCPFTTDWLEDPVRSRTCGHRFSRAPVTAYLLGRQGANPAFAAATAAGRVDPSMAAPCQQAGCRQMISLAVLMDDPAAARDVAKARAEERRQEAAGDAAIASAAAAAAARKRRRGTVKHEAGADDGAVNDLTQQEEEPGAAAAAAAPSPQRRGSKRTAH